HFRMVGWPGHRKCDVVVANVRGCFKVHNWDARGRAAGAWRTKCDSPSLEAVLGAAEVRLSLEDVGTPKQHGFCRVASDAQIGIATQTNDASLHLQVRRGRDMQIE